MPHIKEGKPYKDFPEYDRYEVCKLMGWDYYTYESQPVWFIGEILSFLSMEAQLTNGRTD